MMNMLQNGNCIDKERFDVFVLHVCSEIQLIPESVNKNFTVGFTGVLIFYAIF
jgi:hypothetical protein